MTKLANILTGLGVVVLLLAVAWWGGVFYFLAEATGSNLIDFTACLVAPTQTCNFYRSMGWMQGAPIYEPGVFWVALVLLVSGFYARRT